jgi:hypothetical protein
LNAWYLAVGKIDPSKGFWYFFTRYMPFLGNKNKPEVPKPPSFNPEQA